MKKLGFVDRDWRTERERERERERDKNWPSFGLEIRFLRLENLISPTSYVTVK